MHHLRPVRMSRCCSGALSALCTSVCPAVAVLSHAGPRSPVHLPPSFTFTSSSPTLLLSSLPSLLPVRLFHPLCLHDPAVSAAELPGGAWTCPCCGEEQHVSGQGEAGMVAQSSHVFAARHPLLWGHAMRRDHASTIRSIFWAVGGRQARGGGGWGGVGGGAHGAHTRSAPSGWLQCTCWMSMQRQCFFCTRPAPCEIQQLSRVPLPCPALPAADWIIVSFVMVVGLACAQRGFANSSAQRILRLGGLQCAPATAARSPASASRPQSA